MPTYHYCCRNCGYDFTEVRSFNDDPLTRCPRCGQDQVHQVYSAVPISFRGHGFYRTDRSSGSSDTASHKG
ncbi:MAG: FmdB family zinc ribbon protein [Scardovia wiggsiae]|uniref:FmdB family zinc ribbon protein n=1 Tax=Scardovia wiggsiae TaxID=230143 RepID=UPI001CAD18A9|nr:zinc ribbon domain-containing protein [Scardovia wiggsiae]